MQKFKTLFFIIVVAAAALFVSCQHDSSPVEPFASNNPQVELSKVMIPNGATIDSAAFFINVSTAFNQEVTLHQVTANWQEMMVTWNNFAGSYNMDTVAAFTPDMAGWYSIEVTNLVNSWFDGSYPNFGMLLKQTSPAQFQTYTSKEEGNGAYIKVWWTLNGYSGYDSSGVFEDSYIRSDSSDNNYGSAMELITGWQDTVEAQTLVKFEIEKVYTGCTHGSGYWKTHSMYGPAPYDSTWALLGEDSTFFLSGKTNYEVMWTPPKKGNAYYILSFAYIGTVLNLLNGADPYDVQEAFDEATDLFETYTPEYIGSLRGNDPLRQQFLSLKGTLEQYNGGMIGPGTCDNTGLRPDKKQ